MDRYEQPPSEQPSSPGSEPAHFLSTGEIRGGGDEDHPGQQPDEIVPTRPDFDHPGGAPDEVSPDQRDFDRPGRTPIEHPPQPGTQPDEAPPPD